MAKASSKKLEKKHEALPDESVAGEISNEASQFGQVPLTPGGQKPSLERSTINTTEFIYVVPDDKLLVDKKLFLEMFYALGAGYSQQYSRMAGINAIGKMCGLKTQKEAMDFYTEASKQVRK